MVNDIEDFSVQRLESDRPQSDLLWREDSVGLRVDGVSLERQWRVAPGYLLFLTEDSPFEEGLHIYLLDDDKRVVDALELSGPYASAILKDAVAEGDATVSFSFFGDDRWRLDVHATPQRALRVPMFSPVKRKPGLKGKPVLSLHRVR
jgi:hypothetical protein